MNSKKSTDGKQSQRRSVHMGFKSPLIARTTGGQQGSVSTPSSDQHLHKVPRCPDNSSRRLDQNLWDTDRLQREVDDLKEHLREVEQQIQQLKDNGLDESELAVHITKLHEYNEIKDTAQMVLGHIASLRGIRTSELYPKYGLELDD